MSYIYDPFSRRSFIRGMGGLIACPLLSSLLPSSALAAANSPKRFVAITTPNQLPNEIVHTSGYGKNIPGDILSLVSNHSDGKYPYRKVNLSQIAAARGQVSAFIDSKYNSYLSKMALARGLDMPGRVDHGRSTSLGNIAGSHLGSERKYEVMRTMDEFLANSSNFYSNGKSAYRFPVLRLGESSISTSQANVSALGISGANANLTLNGNLKSIFDFGFADQTASVQKAHLIDRILEGVTQIKSGGKIGSADVQILNQFMDQMNDLNNSLKNYVVPPAKPAVSLLDLSSSNQALGNLPDGPNITTQYYQDAAKLVVLALQCGLTKIATIGVDSGIVSPGNSVSQGGTVGHWHLTIAHGNDFPKLLAVNKFVFDTLFFEIMKGLDVIEPGTGVTYLDNTLIYFTPECSFGHSGINFGSILAGNSAGGIQLGNSFDYSNWSHSTSTQDLGPGQPINRLWLGMLNSLGLAPSDYLGRFGNNSKTFGVWQNAYPEGWEAQFGSVSRGDNVGYKLNGLFT